MSAEPLPASIRSLEEREERELALMNRVVQAGRTPSKPNIGNAESAGVAPTAAATLKIAEPVDCVDWFAGDELASKRPTVGNADAATPATVRLRTEPEPLRRPVPPPEPYPIAELGPILGPACESLRRVIQAPDAVCGSVMTQRNLLRSRC